MIKKEKTKSIFSNTNTIITHTSNKIDEKENECVRINSHQIKQRKYSHSINRVTFFLLLPQGRSTFSRFFSFYVISLVISKFECVKCSIQDLSPITVNFSRIIRVRGCLILTLKIGFNTKITHSQSKNGEFVEFSENRLFEW